MAVNDTALLSIRGTVFGFTHIHTLHFRHIDLTSTEQTLIDEWRSACRTAYRNCFATLSFPVQLIKAAQVCGAIPLRAPVESAEPGATANGTIVASGDPAPSWLASVHSLRTASAGKSRRGRYFLGGLYENMIALNDLDSATVIIRAAYGTALLGQFGPSGTSGKHRLVVHSRKLADVPGTLCENSSTLVTSILHPTAIGSQKSRKPGSGT